ncbi:MAG: cytidine deaminase [Candidatus Hodarchaeota archaeon]
MSNYNVKRLVEAAKEARKFSQAKYSNFRVGAAILTEDDQIYTGCNVESSSYGLTICAERVALTKALSEGKTRFKAIAIFAKEGEFCPPCGACRQLLVDYAPKIEVILSDNQTIKSYKISDLLPLAFEESQLD